MSDFDTTLSTLGITRSSTSTTTAASNSQGLTQSDFLTLMTAQLKNQDPFEPVDNTQMVAQMAQMSSTSGIADMNSTLKAIAAKLNATSSADAMGYVGKTVLTEGGTAYPRTAGGIAGAVELGAAATDVVVNISDSNGAVLQTLSLGAQAAGTVNYDWGGKTAAGADAGSGPFTVEVAAANNGATVSAKSLVWAPVESVSTPASGDPVLSVTGLGTVALSAIRSVG
ncbi:flagellar hook capping FlgD N-terminal domain-containing protein [Sphingomonas sp. PB2P19]|uniref:flagellar hook assembly protein FlgD n=1 Tax=Sphingomonas rhamnosi TaxID=3096156 RepID=UPI002FC92EA5